MRNRSAFYLCAGCYAETVGTTPCIWIVNLLLTGCTYREGHASQVAKFKQPFTFEQAAEKALPFLFKQNA